MVNCTGYAWCFMHEAVMISYFRQKINDRSGISYIFWGGTEKIFML
ncbi:hypothetical protein [Elizabethkingia anophelis]